MRRFLWLFATNRRKNRTMILSAFVLVCILFSMGGTGYNTEAATRRSERNYAATLHPENNISRGSLDKDRENPDLEENYHFADKHTATVIIDPGHGGLDSGTEADGILEKDINLDIGLRMGKLLNIPGIQVIYTRATDEYISINQRVAFANNSNADLFISIHNNAFEDDPTIYGTSTLYFSSSRTKNDIMNSQKLAEIVQQELVEHLQAKDNGTFYRNSLGVLKYVTMPSIIAEVGYISNAAEKAHLTDPDYRQKAAAALANAVIKALNQMEAGSAVPGK